jgi:hypothetical protein
MRRSTAAMLGLLALSGCGGGGAGGAGTAPGTPSPVASVADGVVRTGGCATATRKPEPFIDGTPQPSNQAALSDLADRVRPRAEKDFAAVFAALSLVQERDRIQVFRKPSVDFDRWIVRDFAAYCVEVLDAKYSAVEVESWQRRVTGDMKYWRQHGIEINSVGADAIRGLVVVGTLDVDRARQELPARYGPDLPIEVERQEPIGW